MTLTSKQDLFDLFLMMEDLIDITHVFNGILFSRCIL